MLGFIGSVCAPDKATFTAEIHGLQCTTAGPYSAIPCLLLHLGTVCGLGPDLIGIHTISLAACYRVAACSSTLRRGLQKSMRHGGTIALLSLQLSPAWEHDFLFHSMTFHTANAIDIVCRLGRDDILDEVPQNKKQKVASGLLLDKLRTQDFAGHVSGRDTRVLGPISLHRIADILRDMKRVSRASRPGSCLLELLPRALHRYFTLRKTIILAVLDVGMNLTPSLTTKCVPNCTTSFFPSGGTPRWCHQEIACCTTWSPG